MDRYKMIQIIGEKDHTANIEDGEYSYVKEAGGKAKLDNTLGETAMHYKADIRFEKDDTVVIVETKQKFEKKDEAQLAEYVAEERALHKGKKIIGILADTNDDKIKVWKSVIDDNHILPDETVLDSMEHYMKLFRVNQQNNREQVLKNTYALNELLHKKDIDEKLRSQFVGTSLLYIKDMVKKTGCNKVTQDVEERLIGIWQMMDAKAIRAAIEATLDNLLDGSKNKAKKIELLQKNVLNDQKVKNLKTEDWIEILKTILMSIFRYINADSSEGQDILNMFFIAFNKYTGKADKNQAFTPDHITDFMCQVTGVNRDKRVLDT